MSKIVLDEKEVNELMDNFDFQKSKYLQELKKVTGIIEKLDEIQKTQKEITDKLESYTSILSNFNSKNEKELTANYASYLAFLSKKIDELNKNSNLKKLEHIISISNNIVSFSIAKLAATIAVCVVAFYILMKLN
ncbi:hypothetical protein ACN4FT_02810 [Aliarcobacter butzleri]|uniref:hypothetical protein n=1 Tax=Aliarcobacter butzleri TaxID=28197 RepID=UPI00102DF723|nr:hypothetical protein [Aliarcobacter butzleri]RZV14525.1 hypothetical protein D3M61_04610 [Aliarcobacter butzleri]